MRVLIPTFLFFFVFPGAFGMIVENGNTVVIDRPVFEDIYLAGGTVTVNASVHGDIVAAGGTIHINDTVIGEELVAGANVTVNGYVTGKVRCIAGRLRIAQHIDGDLVIAGGTLSLEHNAVIAGSLLATGGNLVLNGIVRRDIRAACASLKVYDSVGGNIDCRGTDIEINAPIGGASTLVAGRQLDIGTAAAFYQDVDYWAPETVDFGSSLKGAKVVRDESLRPYGQLAQRARQQGVVPLAPGICGFWLFGAVAPSFFDPFYRLDRRRLRDMSGVWLHPGQHSFEKTSGG